jgi:hypothetical protein
VCVGDLDGFFVGQDAETLGSAALSGRSRATVLAVAGRPLLVPLPLAWLAASVSVPPDSVEGLLLDPLPGLDVDGTVEVELGVGVGVVTVGVGVGV